MIDIMIFHTTQRKQHVCWCDQINHRFGTQQELGSEIKNLALYRGVSLTIGHAITAVCRDDNDIKRQFRRQNVVGNMLVRKFSFACTCVGKHPTVQVILLPHLWMCSLASFIPELY